MLRTFPALPRLVAALGVVWLASVTLVYPSTTRLDVWPWAGIVSGGWWAMILAAVCGGMHRRFGGIRDAALLLFTVTVVASAWTSPWNSGSLASVLAVPGGLALAYLLLSAFASSEHKKEAASAVDGIATLVIAAGMLSWLTTIAAAPEGLPAALSRRNDSLFGHSVTTAGAALLAGSWLMSRGAAFTGWARGWRIAAAIIAVAMVLTTASRAAVGALALATACGFCSWWWRRGCRLRDAGIGISVLIVLVTVGVASNQRLRHLVLTGEWSAISSASNGQRLAMAETGWALGRDHGMLGPGPGTVPLAFNAGRARVSHAPDGALQLHSAPIQIWATTGPAGLLAVGLILVGFVPLLWRALKPGAPFSEALLASGIIGYACFALTDHQFDVPFILALVLGHLAMLTAPVAPPISIEGARRRIALAAAAILVVGGPTVFRFRDLAARAAFSRAVGAQGDTVLALTALGQAESWAPWDRYYAESAAAWTWDIHREDAIDRLRKIVAADAAWPSEFAIYNLAWLELLRPGSEELPLFRQAAQLAPHRRGVHFGLSLALAASGDRAGAVHALARECIANPLFVTEPVWADPSFKQMWPEVQVEIELLAVSLPAFLTDPAQRDQLRYVVQLIQWWRSPTEANTTALIDDAPEVAARQLQAAAAAPPAGSGTWPGAEQWGLLAETWAAGRPPESLDEAWRRPLARRLEAADDFAGFITGSVADVPVWRQPRRVTRGGYGIVMEHPDGPPLQDFPIFEENALVGPYLSALFPFRGWLPGRAWRMLDAESSSRHEDL